MKMPTFESCDLNYERLCRTFRDDLRFGVWKHTVDICDVGLILIFPNVAGKYREGFYLTNPGNNEPIAFVPFTRYWNRYDNMGYVVDFIYECLYEGEKSIIVCCTFTTIDAVVPDVSTASLADKIHRLFLTMKKSMGEIPLKQVRFLIPSVTKNAINLGMTHIGKFWNEQRWEYFCTDFCEKIEAMKYPGEVITDISTTVHPHRLRYRATVDALAVKTCLLRDLNNDSGKGIYSVLYQCDKEAFKRFNVIYDFSMVLLFQYPQKDIMDEICSYDYGGDPEVIYGFDKQTIYGTSEFSYKCGSLQISDSSLIFSVLIGFNLSNGDEFSKYPNLILAIHTIYDYLQHYFRIYRDLIGNPLPLLCVSIGNIRIKPNGSNPRISDFETAFEDCWNKGLHAVDFINAQKTFEHDILVDSENYECDKELGQEVSEPMVENSESEEIPDKYHTTSTYVLRFMSITDIGSRVVLNLPLSMVMNTSVARRKECEYTVYEYTYIPGKEISDDEELQTWYAAIEATLKAIVDSRDLNYYSMERVVNTTTVTTQIVVNR